MDPAVLAEIENLRQMKPSALRIKYREVFGEESRSSNRQFLFRRIAWRLQANVEGDLSERARRRALEIADHADLRIRAPQGFFEACAPSDTAQSLDRAGAGRDRRLPCPGALLTRQFDNRRTAESSSRSWKTASSINLSTIVRSARLPAKSPELVGMVCRFLG